MRLLVVGGRLQGTEACYLAAEAGIETVLVDRCDDTPASGLAADVRVCDITADAADARSLVRSCDAVLPTCENDATLAWLAAHVPAWDVPLVFGPAAYEVTSSKVRSNELFAALDLPRPLPWPRCGLPVVVKPSVGSGSQGVRVVPSEPALALVRAEMAARGEEPVIEEYVPGPSLSLEVLGRAGEVAVLQPTGLEFDEIYDCKRVIAPVGPVEGATKAALSSFTALSARLGEALEVEGIMDVEVMVAGDQPKVLEIDARLPSQTPATVFHSSDLNMVELLCSAFVDGRLPDCSWTARRGAVYQHVLIADGCVEVRGEHVVGSAGPLARQAGRWGAQVALVDAREGQSTWVAIIMTRGADLAEARAVADAAVQRLAGEHGLEVKPERGPSSAPGDGPGR